MFIVKKQFRCANESAKCNPKPGTGHQIENGGLDQKLEGGAVNETVILRVSVFRRYWLAKSRWLNHALPPNKMSIPGPIWNSISCPLQDSHGNHVKLGMGALKSTLRLYFVIACHSVYLGHSLCHVCRS